MLSRCILSLGYGGAGQRKAACVAMGLLLGAGFAAGLASAQGNLPILLPSGETALLHDQIWDEDQARLRLRYVVAALAVEGGDYAEDFLAVFEDMAWLCETQLRALFPDGADPAEEGWDGAIMTMMSEPVEFGARDASVIQFFESFLFQDGSCVLEDDLHHD